MIETVQDAVRVPDTAKGIGKHKTSSKLPKFAFSVLLVWLLAFVTPEETFNVLRLGGQECSKPDVITGFTLLKNKHIVWKQEGFSSGPTNSMGFLDYEHELRKPPGVCRIAMLGDSMTESLQVPQSSRFSNVLERRLDAIQPGKFEVFNFGISAAGTGQEYLTYLRYVEQFRPDITILFFDCGDEDKNGKKPAMGQWHPHVVFGLDGTGLTVSWRDYDAWLHSASAIPIVYFESNRSKSRVWGILVQAINCIKHDESFTYLCAVLDRINLLEPIRDCLASCLPANYFGPSDFKLPQSAINAIRNKFCSEYGLRCPDSQDSSIARFNERDFEFGREPEFHTKALTREQTEEIVRRYLERWRLTLTILKRFSDECKRTNSKFVIVGFPAVHDKQGFDRAFEQVTSLADQKSTYAVNLTSAFDSASKAKDSSPRISSHLSVTGHGVMADLLFKYLVQHNLLTGSMQFR